MLLLSKLCQTISKNRKLIKISWFWRLYSKTWRALYVVTRPGSKVISLDIPKFVLVFFGKALKGIWVNAKIVPPTKTSCSWFVYHFLFHLNINIFALKSNLIQMMHEELALGPKILRLIYRKRKFPLPFFQCEKS